ncbi:MAG: hypothetical protein JSW27_06640 [Phycisphaerales bacterium]|nr:MAG: hypothetical protein JSW27_06640 [Phycisphaerales bacterium]
MRPIFTARDSQLRHCLCIYLTVVALIATNGCDRNGNPSESVVVVQDGDPQDPIASQSSEPREAPLLLLEDEPLLLLEDDSAPAELDGPVADNTRCFVCHANYLNEEIAATHARANIGCAGCHGESDAHIADESWGSGGNGTAPDIMYPKANINPSCMRCHPQDEIDIPEHEPVFANAAESKVCTDCHGDPRLTVRRCTWK